MRASSRVDGVEIGRGLPTAWTHPTNPGSARTSRAVSGSVASPARHSTFASATTASRGGVPRRDTDTTSYPARARVGTLWNPRGRPPRRRSLPFDPSSADARGARAMRETRSHVIDGARTARDARRGSEGRRHRRRASRRLRRHDASDDLDENKRRANVRDVRSHGVVERGRTSRDGRRTARRAARPQRHRRSTRTMRAPTASARSGRRRSTRARGSAPAGCSRRLVGTLRRSAADEERAAASERGAQRRALVHEAFAKDARRLESALADLERAEKDRDSLAEEHARKSAEKRGATPSRGRTRRKTRRVVRAEDPQRRYARGGGEGARGTTREERRRPRTRGEARRASPQKGGGQSAADNLASAADDARGMDEDDRR